MSKKSATANVNAFVVACEARIADAKSSASTIDVLKQVKTFVENESVVAFLNESNVTTKFDFDVHTLRQLRDVVNFAMNKNTMRDVKEDFYHCMLTMINLAKDNLTFSAKDFEACLIKSIKIDSAKAKYYSRRNDHYENAGNWHMRFVKLMSELNVITSVSKREYKINDNTFAKAIAARFASA